MSSALALPQPESAAPGCLAADRAVIESRLSALLDSGQPATPLRRVPQYAVLGQGQRIRPILALRIAPLRGQENFLAPLVMAASAGGVAVERFSRNRSYARRAAVPQVLCPFAPPLDRFASRVVRSNLTPLEAFNGSSRNTVDPVIDPPNWCLRIALDGQPLKSFTYAELLALPRLRRIATISNTLKSNLMGTAGWSGVFLRQLIDPARVPGGVREVALLGAEGPDDSLPFPRAFSDEPLLALRTTASNPSNGSPESASPSNPAPPPGPAWAIQKSLPFIQ